MIHQPMLRQQKQMEQRKRIHSCVGVMIIIASFNKTRYEEMRTPYTFSETMMKEFRWGILFGLNSAHFIVQH